MLWRTETLICGLPTRLHASSRRDGQVTAEELTKRSLRRRASCLTKIQKYLSAAPLLWWKLHLGFWLNLDMTPSPSRQSASDPQEASRHERQKLEPPTRRQCCRESSSGHFHPGGNNGAISMYCMQLNRGPGLATPLRGADGRRPQMYSVRLRCYEIDSNSARPLGGHDRCSIFEVLINRSASSQRARNRATSAAEMPSSAKPPLTAPSLRDERFVRLRSGRMPRRCNGVA